jgi:hypothetical protein
MKKPKHLPNMDFIKDKATSANKPQPLPNMDIIKDKAKVANKLPATTNRGWVPGFIATPSTKVDI